MSEIFSKLEPRSRYFDKEGELNEEDYAEGLKSTTTVYVGNLYFGTRENQIYHYFLEAGPIKRLIMSKHKKEKKSWGFCFIEYEDHQSARNAVRYLHRTKLDRRVLKVDLDVGFSDGREFGRGDLGGQKRDDYNEDGTKKPVPVEEDENANSQNQEDGSGEANEDSGESGFMNAAALWDDTAAGNEAEGEGEGYDHCDPEMKVDDSGW